LFLEKYPSPVIIDEIQYAPQLLPYIKAKADKTKGKCSFWITGSQHFHLMKNVSESLAGRAAIINLLGFSQVEENTSFQSREPWIPKTVAPNQKYPATNIYNLFKKIVRGSYPKLFIKNPPSIETFYGSYLQTYIDRDLRDLVRVGSLSSFEKFLRLCAARTGQMLNMSDIANDADISVNTAKEWLSLLEASGHIYMLKPYYKNITKRLVKTPKLYFLDTGLACYLTGWRTPETTSKGAMAGPLFETFILSELIKSYWNRGEEAPLWFYRTKEKEEVDIVIDRDGLLHPIEIKLSVKITEWDLKGIKSLKKTHSKIGKGAFISVTPKPYFISEDIEVVPYTVATLF